MGGGELEEGARPAVAGSVLAPVLGIAVGVLEFASASTGALATPIECFNGGSSFLRVAGLGGLAIPVASYFSVEAIQKQYGDELNALAGGILGALGVANVRAGVARERRMAAREEPMAVGC